MKERKGRNAFGVQTSEPMTITVDKNGFIKKLVPNPVKKPITAIVVYSAEFAALQLLLEALAGR